MSDTDSTTGMNREELLQEIERLRAHECVTCQRCDAIEAGLVAELVAANARADSTEHNLRDLLAVVHRDGGHYAEEHGLDRATQDAMPAFYARIEALSGPCRCDPVGSGEEFCHDTCSANARAEAAEAELKKLLDGQVGSWNHLKNRCEAAEQREQALREIIELMSAWMSPRDFEPYEKRVAALATSPAPEPKEWTMVHICTLCGKRGDTPCDCEPAPQPTAEILQHGESQ